MASYAFRQVDVFTALPFKGVASQGTALGRSGLVQVTRIGGDIWIGGETATCIEGRLSA